MGARGIKVQLSADIAARWVDSLILKSDTSSKLYYGTLARLVSTCVFPFFIGSDCLRLGISALFSSNATTYQRRTTALKYSILGLISSPSGLISPDLVSSHFLQNPNRSRRGFSPYGKLYSTNAKKMFPETITHVKRIVLKAIRAKRSIAICGAGMSQGKQVLPHSDKDFFLDMSKMNKIQIDRKAKVATVEAGATWYDVQEAANQQNLAIKVMQASNVFSIGGSISANCHGWRHKTGTIANTIKSLTVLDGQGNVRVVRPGDQLFNAVVGGYGLFGVIVKAEIKLAKNRTLTRVGEEVAPQDYADYFTKKILPSNETKMHLYRLSLDPKALLQSGVAVSYFKGDKVTRPTSLVDEPEHGGAIYHVMLHLARRIKSLRGLFWKIEKYKAKAERPYSWHQMLKNPFKAIINASGLPDKVCSTNAVMRPPIKVVFNESRANTEWLQEYFVEKKNLAPFLKKLGSTLTKNNVPLLNATVRYVKKDTISELGYAKKGDRFAVVLFFNQSLAKNKVQQTQNWVRKINDYVVANNGSYYLPYQAFATQRQFQKSYPQWKRVGRLKKKLDPHEIYRSGFSTEYLQRA